MTNDVLLVVLTLVLGIAVGYFWPRKQAVMATVVPIASSQLQKRATELTQTEESVDASGEYKRHKVYAQLIKEFPEDTKRNISKAIEAAL